MPAKLRRTRGTNFNNVISDGNGDTEIRINNAFFEQSFKCSLNSVKVMRLLASHSTLFQHLFATTWLMKLIRGNCPKCIGQVECFQQKNGRERTTQTREETSLLLYIMRQRSTNVRLHRLNFDQEMGQPSTIQRNQL